jgi:hypothetical protein
MMTGALKGVPLVPAAAVVAAVLLLVLSWKILKGAIKIVVMLSLVAGIAAAAFWYVQL